MSSNADFDRAPLDLERDVPTTAEDVRVLRELRRRTPSWFALSAPELSAILSTFEPRRRPMRDNPTPFTLE